MVYLMVVKLDLKLAELMVEKTVGWKVCLLVVHSVVRMDLTTVERSADVTAVHSVVCWDDRLVAQWGEHWVDWWVSLLVALMDFVLVVLRAVSSACLKVETLDLKLVELKVGKSAGWKVCLLVVTMGALLVGHLVAR